MPSYSLPNAPSPLTCGTVSGLRALVAECPGLNRLIEFVLEPRGAPKWKSVNEALSEVVVMVENHLAKEAPGP